MMSAHRWPILDSGGRQYKRYCCGMQRGKGPFAVRVFDAPRGRALVPDELVAIALEIDPTVQQPAARRTLLLQVLDTVQAQGAQATVEDLAAALDVSASTVRRDLRQLRTQGHLPTTRGTGTG